MTQVRAIRFHQTGGVVVLTEETVDLPAPGPGQVLVRNTAVGVNFIDTYFRTGLYPAPLPFTPGLEGAGLIEAVGEGVTGLNVGDRVVYLAVGGGGYATHTLAPASHTVPLPDAIGEDAAAATFLKGLTAWMLLFEVWRARPGETALVWAAAGGVGSLLVPWAVSLGVRVIGVVSTEEKAARVRTAGADHVLRADEDIAARVAEITGGAGVDVVYDSVGKVSADASLVSLRPRGMFVTYGNASGPVDPLPPGRLAQGGSLFMTRPTLFHYVDTPDRMAAGAAALFGAMRAGTLSAQIGQRLDLSEAGKAHTALEGRQTLGATVLVP